VNLKELTRGGAEARRKAFYMFFSYAAGFIEDKPLRLCVSAVSAFHFQFFHDCKR